jgi:NodT family efflux transporter outer membrane factor (OMF) lipoprotein
MPLFLSACSIFSPPREVDAPPPEQWHVPLPHDGSVSNLKQWWQQQNDPLLVELIDAAQKVSPTIASARSRIEQARAVRTAAGAGLLPAFDLAANGTRSNGQPPITPTNTTVQRGLQMAWEIDVFGAGRDTWRSARARHAGARAGWHEARVSVAAEVAEQYFGLRACEKMLEISKADAASRAETARLSELSAKAGFTAPATAALARASAAEGNARATQQQAQCDIAVKILTALTAVPEPMLRTRLEGGTGRLPQAAPVAIETLPAKLLAQRPDVFTAEMEVAAAIGDVGSAQAQRFPRIGLSGFVGRTRFTAAGTTSDSDTWSVGPLSVSLPVFDGGRRAANVDAANARYDEAVANYRATARRAVREVEEALVNLRSTGLRSDDARTSVEGYRASFVGTEARYQGGLASLVELEDARRLRLAAELSEVALQRERLSGWIALYRAAGGGWSRADLDAAQP